MNTITYRLLTLGKNGMYTYGNLASSPALAKLSPGCLILSPGDRLGIIKLNRADDGLLSHEVLEDAEKYTGQWEIGVPNGEGYRAAKTEATV